MISHEPVSPGLPGRLRFYSRAARRRGSLGSWAGPAPGDPKERSGDHDQDGGTYHGRREDDCKRKSHRCTSCCQLRAVGRRGFSSRAELTHYRRSRGRSRWKGVGALWNEAPSAGCEVQARDSSFLVTKPSTSTALFGGPYVFGACQHLCHPRQVLGHRRNGVSSPSATCTAAMCSH